MLETAPALPLAFLPGAGGRIGLLRPIGDRLAPRRTTIFCEYPGLGGVPPDPTLRTLTDLQRHLLAGLPARFDLVSMSMGGVLALQIALQAPERLRKLVLIATSGGINVAKLGGLDWRDSFRRVQPGVPSWFIDDRTDVTSELGRVTHPTLLIFGEADLIAPPVVGEHLQRGLPNGQLEVLPGATHDLEVEQPDLIASLIEAHLRKRD